MVNRELVKQQWRLEDWEDVVSTKRRLGQAEEEYFEAIEQFLTHGTYADLARLLGISPKAVRHYVERGRKA